MNHAHSNQALCDVSIAIRNIFIRLTRRNNVYNNNCECERLWPDGGKEKGKINVLMYGRF